MPVITALQAQAGGNRVKLFLDGDFAFELPLTCAAGLRTGQALSELEVQALEVHSEEQATYDRAVNYLSFRPRSCEEVRRHLVKSGVADAVAANVIDRLQEQGIVDDVAFARFWIENRERFKPMAPRALRYELSQKGVDRDIVDSLLEETDAEASAERAARKLIWRFRGISRDDFRRKLGSRLYRRGFDRDTILSVTDRLEAELEISEPNYFTDDPDAVGGSDKICRAHAK